MKEINRSHDTLRDQQISLESFIEKYLPLKVQNQICETMMECMDKKHKQKFTEINLVMCDVLRAEIMQDTGHSKLKAKTLDLISKLRLEANVLNAAKTAKAANNAHGAQMKVA